MAAPTQTQLCDVTLPLFAKDGQGAPVIMYVYTKNQLEMGGGVPSVNAKKNSYVLFDVLPDELKRQVKMFVDASRAAM